MKNCVHINADCFRILMNPYKNNGFIYIFFKNNNINRVVN